SLFDSDQSKFYREMFDDQLAMNMADGGGLGLADAIVQQLGGAPGQPGGVGDTERGHVRVSAATAPSPSAAPRQVAPPQAPAHAPTLFEEPMDFVGAVWDYAREAAAALGTVPQVLVAQAALETGWGRHILARADGGSSNNLFGIKA